MALTPGTRLGVYDITALIGAGGMGEVYRATDVTLGREVAIKVLPDTFAQDAERLARFEREAKTLASVNHPHIAAIYGFEKSGGAHALVMELVEGPTLANRIAEGPIPIDEALVIARQIADALEAAHEQGIIHRDLKPANIKVRSDGTVKVLDFGLAKLIEPGSGIRDSGSGGAGVLSISPTITSPAMTLGGMILGTAAYMSPEQARGKQVDKRADIWAFGCVLYEMLTGRRPFDADDVSLTMARVLEREPDFDALPPSVPARVRQALRVCLRKDPKQRAGDIRDVRLAIEGAFETSAAQAAAPVVAARWRRVAIASAAAVLATAVVATTITWLAMRAVSPRVSRLSIAPSGNAALSINGTDRDLTITPDGSRVVYIGNRGTQLFVRALDALEPVAVFTGAPRGLFVSYDGQWIGFVDGTTTLKKVAVTGGPAITLATLDGTPRGATWGPDDSVIFATQSAATGLQRVGAAGGPVTVLTRPDRAQGELDHFWPEMLPGGRAVLFTITAVGGGLDAAQVAVLDVQTGTRKVLVRGGSHAHYAPSGHLVYAAAGTLRSVPFDLARLETRGTPVPVVPDVMTTSQGGVDAVVASDGTLAYVSGGAMGAGQQRTLVWVDRQGHETPIPAPPRAYLLARLSPDGTRVALWANDQQADIWIWDLSRATLTRVTFDPAADGYPVWTPDGRRLIFSSERAGARNLFWQAADGTGAVERLADSPNLQDATAVSPDGRRLTFIEVAPKTAEDVMQIELDGAHRVTPLVQSAFSERNGIISPDGRWLAYDANDSGRFEVFVRPYPDVNSGHWQVSTTGGARPLWAPSGQELFYASPTGALMRVGVERAPLWAATTPTMLVKEGYYTNPSGTLGRPYDISLDGQRFLVIKEDGGADQTAQTAAPPQLIVVQHWTEELKRLVPIK